MPSPLQLYQQLLAQSQGMAGKYAAAGEEQRQGYDKGMGEINSAYAEDQRGPLLALSAGLMKPAAGGFAGQASAGLDSFRTASDRERAIQRDRADKIAALQAARSKVSEDVLKNDQGLIQQQIGLTGGMQNTISSDRTYGLAAHEQAQKDQDRQRWSDALKALGAGGDGQPRAGLSPEALILAGAAGPDRGPSILAGAMKNDDALEAQRRTALADKYGLKEGDPRRTAYILTGTLPKEQQQALTATDKKAVMEADDQTLAAQNAIDSLHRAQQMSPKAWGGVGAATASKFLSPFSQGAEDTANLDAEVTQNALSQLRSIFGGNPTEGERAILLEIAGSSSKPDAVRQGIYKRAEALAQRRLQMNKQRADELRGMTYYQPGGGGASRPQGAPGDVTPAPQNAAPAPGGADPLGIR